MNAPEWSARTAICKGKGQKGKTFTFHGQRSARYMLKDTCVRCHTYWTPEEAEYQVDAIQNYIRGKMRKAEFWLEQMIETYVRARDLGVREQILREVWPLHDKAHVLWEWWTAKTVMASTTPMRPGSLSPVDQRLQEGIKILEEAIKDRRK